MKLLVEGWRFIPHSYALVNQYQLLELAKHVQVVHRDAPWYRGEWQAAEGVFEPEQERALRDIPAASPGERADAVYRVSFPFDFGPSAAPRTLVFGTSEYGCIPGGDIAPMRSLAKALETTDYTIVTPSRWSRDGFLRAGTPAERVALVPHGADIGTFRPLRPPARAALRARLGLDSFTFLTVGSLSANKGIDLLFKAFAAVLQRHPSARLLVKGLDALYPSREFLAHAARLLSTAERESVQARLAYVGDTLGQRLLAELYQAADAYVSPYLAEGFNLPVLEAAASGLPVICTSGGPTDDFTAPGFALRIDSVREPATGVPGGVLLRPDPEHLLHHMLQCVEDPGIGQRARASGPAFVEAGFTWEQAVRRLLEVAFPER